MRLSAFGTVPFIIFIVIIYWMGFGFGFLTGKFSERDKEDKS